MDEHRKIYDAIAARDEDKARHAMRNHLSLSQTRYQKLLTQR